MVELSDFPTKYFFFFNDRNNYKQQKIEIRQRGFTGQVRELIMPDENTIQASYNPFQWSLTSSDEEYSPTMPGQATVSMITVKDQEFIEFLDAKNQEYLVVWNLPPYRGYIGFINPQQYVEEYLAPPYISVLQSSDGLGLLQDIEVDAPKENMSYIRIIGLALQKTGLPVNEIYTVVDLFETRMQRGANDSPLDQTYYHMQYAYDENDNPRFTWFELLEYLLTPMGATIMQSRGQWWVIRSFGEYFFRDPQVVRFNLEGMFSGAFALSYDDHFRQILCRS